MVEVAKLPELTFHPEIAHAPMLINGFSFVGFTACNLVRWYPERVIAFSWNIGMPCAALDENFVCTFHEQEGIDWERNFGGFLDRPSVETMKVPGLFILGRKDQDKTRRTMAAVYDPAREADSSWTWVWEPGVGYQLVNAPDLDLAYYKKILPRY